MTISKIDVIEEFQSIVICATEAQPADTKVYINNEPVPIQAVYGPDNGYNPAPEDRDQFSMAFCYLNVPNWTLGDSFEIGTDNSKQVIVDYLRGFEL